MFAKPVRIFEANMVFILILISLYHFRDYFYLPKTPEGFSIVFHRLSSSKPSHYHFDEAIKTFFMSIGKIPTRKIKVIKLTIRHLFLDSCLQAHGPSPGIIFLFDMKGVSIGHLTRIRISSIKKFFHYLQEGLPAKLQAIHVLNVVSFFDKILSLIKPFMKADIFKMVK